MEISKKIIKHKLSHLNDKQTCAHPDESFQQILNAYQGETMETGRGTFE